MSDFTEDGVDRNALQAAYDAYDEERELRPREGTAAIYYAIAAYVAAAKTPAPLPTDGAAEPVLFVSPEQFKDRANFNSNYMPFRLSVEGKFTMPLFTHPPKPQAATDAMVKAAMSVPPIPNRGPNVFSEDRMRAALEAALAASQSEGGK